MRLAKIFLWDENSAVNTANGAGLGVYIQQHENKYHRNAGMKYEGLT